MQQWQRWEDAADQRSPMLLCYGLVAGGGTIGLCLLIAFLQQNAGAIFTATAAEVLAITTAFAVLLCWYAGRR